MYSGAASFVEKVCRRRKIKYNLQHFNRCECCQFVLELRESIWGAEMVFLVEKVRVEERDVLIQYVLFVPR